MSAAEALKAARAAGLDIRLDGGDLVLEASVPPPPTILDLLSRHKPGIVALLRRANDAWSANDWLTFFEERAARIAAFGSGLPRAEAEARAFACCVVRWLSCKPERSLPGQCVGCGQAESAHDMLLPFGTESTGHAWLHSRCWPAWHAGRQADAVVALRARGIAM